MVIIKKQREVVIDHPLGAIFRGVNIVEYKSPGSHLSISDFHKVGAYARLYSVQNGVETTDMSISFVLEVRPRKVLDYLRAVYGFEVREEWSGIYYVAPIPIQIIESKRLGEEEGVVWLKGLRRVEWGTVTGDNKDEREDAEGSAPVGIFIRYSRRTAGD